MDNIDEPPINVDEKKFELGDKDALTLYENGKQRRYGLLFAVNGGALAIIKVITSKENTIQGLSYQHLAVGMVLFTLIIFLDMWSFGDRWSKQLDSRVFSEIGKAVLLLICALICIGWLLVGFGTQ